VADLIIDFGALERTRGSLNDVTDLLTGPCKGMASLPADAAGNADLTAKLRDFGDEWEYGIHKLAEFSSGVGDVLRDTVATFRDLEDQLAAAFD